MSGYFVLKSQQNNGTKSNSIQKHQLFCKIFFYREGQEKAFYHNVRMLYKAKQEPGEIKERSCKEEAVQNVLYDAMKLVLQLYYDAMKQYNYITMQWSNTNVIRCNEASQSKLIQLYYDAMKQYSYITMQWSSTVTLRCNEAIQIYYDAIKQNKIYLIASVTSAGRRASRCNYGRHSSWHADKSFHILRQSVVLDQTESQTCQRQTWEAEAGCSNCKSIGELGSNEGQHIIMLMDGSCNHHPLSFWPLGLVLGRACYWKMKVIYC